MRVVRDRVRQFDSKARSKYRGRGIAIPSSLFILSAANPMLFRSSTAITNRAKTNGMIRARTLRVVLASSVLEASAGHPRDKIRIV